MSELTNEELILKELRRMEKEAIVKLPDEEIQQMAKELDKSGLKARLMPDGEVRFENSRP